MRAREHLPIDAIEQLFTRLLVRYGAPFSERWRMLDLKVVKADWARELGRFAQHPEAIEWALDRMPDRPPTVIEFAQLCDQAPRHEAMARSIKPTRPPNDIERETMRQLRERLPAPRMEGARVERSDRQWAHCLLARHASGEKRSTATALAMARDALGPAQTAPGTWRDDDQVRAMREQELLGAGLPPQADAEAPQEEESWF